MLRGSFNSDNDPNRDRLIHSNNDEDLDLDDDVEASSVFIKSLVLRNLMILQSYSLQAKRKTKNLTAKLFQFLPHLHLFPMLPMMGPLSPQTMIMMRDRWRIPTFLYLFHLKQTIQTKP